MLLLLFLSLLLAFLWSAVDAPSDYASFSLITVIRERLHLFSLTRTSSYTPSPPPPRQMGLSCIFLYLHDGPADARARGEDPFEG